MKRTLSRGPVIASCVAGMLVAAGAPLWILTRESWNAERNLDSVIIGLALVVLVALPTFVILAIVRRSPMTLLPFCAGLAVLIGAVEWREELHWRWSRASFGEAADGELDLSGCSSDHLCDVGWWEVSGVEDFGGVPAFWLDDAIRCESSALARPDTEQAQTRVLAAASNRLGMSVQLEDWYDDWVVLCFST